MADEANEKPKSERPPPNAVSTGIQDSHVTLVFQKAVTGIYMTPVEALIIANSLIEKAITVVSNPSRIIRPN